MPFLDIDGVVHHCAVEGQSEAAALVFCNSLGSDLRIWDRVVAHFVNRFRVIRYDKRGHGLSDVPAAPYVIDDYARDLVGILDRLRINDAIICGLSIGGMIAQAFAAAHSGRVRALVLCDTGMTIGTPAIWDDRIATVESGGLGRLVAPSMERWFTQRFRDQQAVEVRGYANMLLRTPVEGYIGACCAIRGADLTGTTLSIRKPTLVLCGDQDVATPPELGQSLARAIPEARFHLIEEAAHLVCIEQPDLLARILMQFFKEKEIV
jgi:3-oxoadipate enol-lactonase